MYHLGEFFFMLTKHVESLFSLRQVKDWDADGGFLENNLFSDTVELTRLQIL